MVSLPLRPAEGFRTRRAAACAALDERAEAGDRFADDQRVHLARALIGVDRFGVCHIATDMVLKQDAIAAEQLARPADCLTTFHRAERLRQRSMLVMHQPL